MNLQIDYRSALVTIGNVTKRLPFKDRCDHVFSQIVWNGTAGTILYDGALPVAFTDSAIVQPFIDMFDIEPAQARAEMIGAKQAMDGVDPEWAALVERHAGTEIQIAAAVAGEAQKVTDAVAAKVTAERTARAVFQDQMNAKRKAMGRPERVYRDGDSFAVVPEETAR